MRLNIEKRKRRPLIAEVKIDDKVKKISEHFDIDPSKAFRFRPWKIPSNIPRRFNIGLIVGSSGSGKSTLLNEIERQSRRRSRPFSWRDGRAIISHFDSVDDGIERLQAAGLSTVPAWLRPFRVLSNGEKFRADLARNVQDYAIIDEFTSVVDRNVAKSAANSMARFIRKKKIKRVTFASCHFDIVPWLNPDWIFNCDEGRLVTRRRLRRPNIRVDIHRCERSLWKLFEAHHYLSSLLLPSCKCFAGYFTTADTPHAGPKLFGFIAAVRMPNARVKIYRIHRLVVLPDYQGFGLGGVFCDGVGELFAENRRVLNIRTVHPKLLGHLERSDKWILSHTKNNPAGKTSSVLGAGARSWKESTSTRSLSHWAAATEMEEDPRDAVTYKFQAGEEVLQASKRQIISLF
jgi:GNAT superfamily N-acetyltransferase